MFNKLHNSFPEFDKRSREDIWDKKNREKIYPSYTELKIDEYYIGKIKILELIHTFTRNNKFTGEDEEIYIYKTSENSYFPSINYNKPLEFNKEYEIAGYKLKDRWSACIIRELL
ncbi:MAG: hypothetical protein WC623_24580 [Pedobacter sp.]|uniref:hypothetical protein n=1 Tax=Pedobacter sp. TaxID=1411316 RepID=UPI00356897B8